MPDFVHLSTQAFESIRVLKRRDRCKRPELPGLPSAPHRHLHDREITSSDMDMLFAVSRSQVDFIFIFDLPSLLQQMAARHSTDCIQRARTIRNA